jgi:hypothetical protein
VCFARGQPVIMIGMREWERDKMASMGPLNFTHRHTPKTQNSVVNERQLAKRDFSENPQSRGF